MPHASDQQIWEAIPDKMKSWRTKQGLPKRSRWFSWNEQCFNQIGEFWCARMILEWYLCPQETPEESQIAARKFSAAFQKAGGLSLMYKCLSEQCYLDAWTLYLVQEPLWQWYSHQLHFIKSPTDGLQEVMRLSSEWQFEEHLQLLAKTIMGPDCLKKFGWLVDMILESEKERDEFAKNAFDYALECLSNRCRTLSKYGAPPMSWANGLSHAPNIQLESRKRLKSDWNRLLLVEMSEAPMANSLAEDLQLLFGAPERLLCQCLEAADFDFRRAPRSLELLAQLVGGFADSKIIEDLHSALRTATGPKGNDRLKGSAIQFVIENSDVLEARAIPHSCSVTKEAFLSQWHLTKPDFKTTDFKASRHKLPKDYSKILASKTWSAISEEDLTRSAAGWAWLRYFLDSRLLDHGFRIQDSASTIEATFSCLLIGLFI